VRGAVAIDEDNHISRNTTRILYPISKELDEIESKFLIVKERIH
jgi:hypothetical protein